MRYIARILERSPSSISREITRKRYIDALDLCVIMV